MRVYFLSFRTLFSIVFILSLVLCSGQWSEKQKVIAEEHAGAYDYFGVSVAISGDIAIVGAYGDDDNGSSSGSAYILEENGGIWSQSTKLLPADGNSEDRFGYSVAIFGNTAIVGAYLDDDNGEDSGSAYVFEKSNGTWSQVSKLLPQDGATGDGFGLSVSISGNRILVGSFWDDDNGVDSGSAYVFERIDGSWTQTFKLLPLDGSTADRFGTSVSISEDLALIGAYYDDFNGSYSGSAYIFAQSNGTWSQEAKILPSDGEFGDNFGLDLSLSDSTAVIGAFRDSHQGYESGSAYVYERSGGAWDHETKLLPTDGGANFRFGWSVSILGSVVVVGSYKDDDNGIHSGTGYTFTRSNGSWNQTEKLVASDGADYDWFGYDVAISGGTIIAGVPIDDDVDTDTGSAFFFSNSDCAPPTITTTVLNESCIGSSDGSITVLTSGGTGSFSYSLDGSLGQESNTFTDLMGAGTEYTVTVIVDEDEECTSSLTVTVGTSPDTIPPSIDCEEDILLINDPMMCGAIVSFNPIATDNCPFALDIICTPPSHSFFPAGTTTVTCVATDDAGNSSSCSFDVTIFDDDNSCPTTDTCDVAHEITSTIFGEQGWQTFPLVSTSSYISCAGDADDAIMFSFIAQSPNDVILAQDPNGGYDVAIEVSDSCDASPFACSNAYGHGQIERALPGNLIVGTQYFFRVYDVASGASASTDVRVQVKTFHDGGVRAADCGETYDLSQSIYAERDDLGQLYSNPGVPVKGYRFLFEEQGGGLVQYVAHVNEAPYLALSDVPGLEYGKTYDVSVSHRVKMAANGTVDEYWSAYGTSCPITIQATIPTTQLKAAFCNNGDYYLEQQIQADAVPGASQYRFTFTEGGNTFTELSNNYAVSLYNVGPFGGPGLEYANVYTVTVEAFVNGAWSAPGTACTIGMHSQPEATGLQSSYCNGTYIYPQNPNYLLAQPVLGAEYYEWRMTPVGGGVAQTQTTTGISLAMHLTTLDLSAGGDWDVEVRAFAGGTLGDYGASCPVTIDTGIGAAQPSGNETAAVKLLSSSKLSQMIYPNPNDGNEFRVNIDGLSENGTAQMILRDLQGRLLEVKSYTYTEKTDFIWRTSATLEAGIYILETQVGQESMATLFTVR